MAPGFTLADTSSLAALFDLERQVIKGYVPSEDPLHVSEFGFAPLSPRHIKALASGTSAAEAVQSLAPNASVFSKKTPFASHAAFRRFVARRALEWSAWTRYPFSYSDRAILERFALSVIPSLSMTLFSFAMAFSLSRKFPLWSRALIVPSAGVAAAALLNVPGSVDTAIATAMTSLSQTTSPLALRVSAIASSAAVRGGAPPITNHPLVQGGFCAARVEGVNVKRTIVPPETVGSARKRAA